MLPAADPIDGGGSTAAAGSRFSAARIQAHVGFFSFFFVFSEPFAAAGVLMWPPR